MIRVTIEIKHPSGSIEVVREDDVGYSPAKHQLARVVAAAEGEATAALTAKAAPR